MLRFYKLSSLILISLLFSCKNDSPENVEKKSVTDSRPNILLVVVDDLGWTDLGCYGSEIKTPNVDKLAEDGVKFSDFHVSVSCSPTRSMLLTGTDNHIAGLGNMSEAMTEKQKGNPGYEGHLNNNVVTLAEILRDGGYHTYMSGKWHLGHEPEQYPAARGFEKSFSMLYGGASYWSDKYGLLANKEETAKYVYNNEEIETLPKDFYATRNYTDSIMTSIRSHKGDGKPFFAYLAFTAVHDPVHVPEPWLSEYKGNYNAGYKALKENRITGAKNVGVFPKDAIGHDLFAMAKNWEDLSDEQKAVESKAMEVYAGMVSNMDYNLGRVINFLKDIDEYDNTIIIFLSDNGSNPYYNDNYPGNKGSAFMAQFDNSAENIGHPMSHYAYGLGWGSACAGPLDLFKTVVGEGGIRVPLIITAPGIEKGRQSDAFAYATDIMPTLLEYANLEHPTNYNGREVAPMRGKSLKKLLTNEESTIYTDQDITAGEMANSRWIRQGKFKASYVPKPFGEASWKLFDILQDPGETMDISKENPEILQKLINSWNDYAKDVGVVIYDN